MRACRFNCSRVLSAAKCLLVLAGSGLLALPAEGQGDGYLKLSEGGDAILAGSQATDLDYAKDFSVEAVVKIEPGCPGGRWALIIAKVAPRTSTLATAPGFSLGIVHGHQQTFGQIIIGKVGDGTNQITVTAKEREGYAYAVLTWEMAARRMILYVNGSAEGEASNPGIDPGRIRNDEVLGIGHKGAYGDLRRDIQLARLWNRKLSADDVKRLWDSFNTTKRHDLPTGVSRTNLLSEWLMCETCNSQGGAGTTHVKDTAGSNHLQLEGSAAVMIGSGVLTVIAPADGATGVNKSVCLDLRGGRNSLSGSIVPPLQYYFEIDETSRFNTTALKQSGWVPHYGFWSPILKPNTLHYWRAKVRDSSTPPKESAFTPVRTFTTEGASAWFVRPRNKNATYGGQNGTSYADAFNGFLVWDNDTGPAPGVVWGPDGVEAGDTLYVCGRHEFDATDTSFVDGSYIYVNSCGYSDEFPVTLRADYVLESGTIVGAGQGYSLKIDRKKYVTFKNMKFEGFKLLTETLTVGSDSEAVTDTPRSTHITFDGCVMANAGCLVTLQTGHDYWAFRRNSLIDSGFGIKTVGRGIGPRYLTAEYNTIKHLGIAPFEDPDAHAFGLTAGEGYLIQNNYIEDTGTAIEFWTATSAMRNMVIRDNFIKNVKVKRITEGHGIAISGENNDSFGLRTGFKVYGNIIVNAEGAGISTNNKDLVEVYNNVICNCGMGLRFAVVGAPVAAAVYNNIVVNPRTHFVYVMGDPNVTWPNVSWNNNLYWPVPHPTAVFGTVWTPGAGFAEYRSKTGWDRNSLAADPRFVTTSPEGPSDFRLLSTSPMIDAGEDVGISRDYVGNPVPCGRAPDIGAYEFTGVTTNKVRGKAGRVSIPKSATGFVSN
jgi:hypothetical protein